MLRSGRDRRYRIATVVVMVSVGIATIGLVPAHALPPTVLAFVPLSGTVGTSVTITGLSFDDTSTATAVRFNGTSTAFTVDSTLQITATVPVGATTGAISVTDSEGTSASPLPFTVTPGAAPLLLSFLPLSGPVGTSVTATGTGFTGATAVRFNGTPTTFSVDSPTQISTTVPAGATSGTISVATPSGTATSPLSFTVTAGATTVRHPRTLTFKLTRHRHAKGRISSADGFTACGAKVTVKIQRRGPHGWRSVGGIRTKATGRFSKHLARRGTYRAVAPRVMLNAGADLCARSVSRPRHRG
jgi:hypothetical protein